MRDGHGDHVAGNAPVEAPGDVPGIDGVPSGGGWWRARRGTIVVLVAAAVLVVAGASVMVARSGGPAGHHASRAITGGSTSTSGPRGRGSLPRGREVSLKVAGDVAVGPDGALYVAAPAQHEIVVRRTDGRFAVVAGDGTAGVAGDGGPALRAELESPYDLTFGSDGSLWFVDQGRVRVVDVAGTIRIVAGDGVGAGDVTGTPSVRLVADGAVARTTSLGAEPHIALAPDGQLYLATTEQLLRLTPTGRLQVVEARQATFPELPHVLGEFGPLAVDGAGNIDVAGVNGWGVWRVSPGGTAQYLGQARRSGGAYAQLVRAPDGGVYVESGSSMLRLGRSGLVPSSGVTGPVAGEYFFMSSFAIARDGTIYASELPGGGAFEAHQQLVAIRGHRVTVLWQQ